MRVPVLILLIFGLAAGRISGQPPPVTESWEPDIFNKYDRRDSGPSGYPQPIGIVRSGIDFYQRVLSPHSISRCPFEVSCSHYAEEAVQRYGLVIGLSMFIDRNLYRENPGLSRNYLRSVDETGELKYDDTFFLRGAWSKRDG